MTENILQFKRKPEIEKEPTDFEPAGAEFFRAMTELARGYAYGLQTKAEAPPETKAGLLDASD